MGLWDKKPKPRGRIGSGESLRFQQARRRGSGDLPDATAQQVVFGSDSPDSGITGGGGDCGPSGSSGGGFDSGPSGGCD